MRLRAARPRFEAWPTPSPVQGRIARDQGRYFLAMVEKVQVSVFEDAHRAGVGSATPPGGTAPIQLPADPDQALTVLPAAERAEYRTTAWTGDGVRRRAGDPFDRAPGATAWAT